MKFSFMVSLKGEWNIEKSIITYFFSYFFYRELEFLEFLFPCQSEEEGGGFSSVEYLSKCSQVSDI